MILLLSKQNRKKLLILFFAGLSYTTYSQVTIGSSDPAHSSAILELKSPDKGFLAPQVLLTDIWDTITVPDYTNGLLVLNMNDSDTEIPVGDRVIAGKYYYWLTEKWVQVVGRQTMDENMEQALSNLGIPRPAIFSLNGKDHIYVYNYPGLDTYDDMLGVINPLQGIMPEAAVNYAYLPLMERVNYTSGTVKLDSTNIADGKKKFSLTFQPGIYSIVFTYEFIPSYTAGSQYNPGHDMCFSATYFMQFPVNIINNDGSITTGLTRIESNCYHGAGTRILGEGRYSDHGNTINYIAVLLTETSWDVALGTGYGDEYCNGRQGLSMPNRSTFLYVSRLGDTN
ncbi:MAG: hypothetical protein LIO93_12760 [Bacteroidales bacterium]|nr:hypothetical protein [Bacteroidales bacterium]